MKCPICRKGVEIGDPFFPFCGERCKTIDLANWATGAYVITRPLQPEEEGAEAGTPGAPPLPDTDEE